MELSLYVKVELEEKAKKGFLVVRKARIKAKMALIPNDENKSNNFCFNLIFLTKEEIKSEIQGHTTEVMIRGHMT